MYALAGVGAGVEPSGGKAVATSEGKVVETNGGKVVETSVELPMTVIPYDR